MNETLQPKYLCCVCLGALLSSLLYYILGTITPIDTTCRSEQQGNLSLDGYSGHFLGHSDEQLEPAPTQELV